MHFFNELDFFLCTLLKRIYDLMNDSKVLTNSKYETQKTDKQISTFLPKLDFKSI